MDRIFQDFRDIVLPGITHWQHPSWFGYFPANNSPASVLAELLTAGLGAQCMVWQTSPAAAELEESVLEWLRQMTRAARRDGRGYPGHGLDGHPLRSPLRQGKSHRFRGEREGVEPGS